MKSKKSWLLALTMLMSFSPTACCALLEALSQPSFPSLCAAATCMDLDASSSETTKKRPCGAAFAYCCEMHARHACGFAAEHAGHGLKGVMRVAAASSKEGTRRKLEDSSSSFAKYGSTYGVDSADQRCSRDTASLANTASHVELPWHSLSTKPLPGTGRLLTYTANARKMGRARRNACMTQRFSSLPQQTCRFLSLFEKKSENPKRVCRVCNG